MTDNDYQRVFHYAAGKPAVTAKFKQLPEDFQVQEALQPEGEEAGEHQWLWVTKRGANTRFVADDIARFAGVPAKAVSYSGMKDRQAVTSQWFSLHAPGKALLNWSQLEHSEFQVERALLQPRKLKLGMHQGNHFVIRLRDVSDAEQLQQRFEHLVKTGVPNYFGEQRFGRERNNIAAAARWLKDSRKRVPKHKQSLWLSAARSWLFNCQISERLAAFAPEHGSHVGTAVTPGDVMMLAGSRSFFLPEAVDATIRERCQQGDLIISCALWGRGELQSEGAVAELERHAVMNYPELAQGLEQQGLKQERRAWWLWPQQAQLDWLDGDAVISFYLPKGVFATSLLRELIELDGADDANSIE